jgi:5-methylcytosine-specific restriction endonuclease McrA
MQGLAACAACGLAFGAQSPHADHIIPIQDENDPLFYCEDNIQFLHPGCHSRKTAADLRAGLGRR